MRNEILNSEAIQICDLEYDVAGVGSAEAVEADVNLAAMVFMFSVSAS